MTPNLVCMFLAMSWSAEFKNHNTTLFACQERNYFIYEVKFTKFLHDDYLWIL